MQYKKITVGYHCARTVCWAFWFYRRSISTSAAPIYLDSPISTTSAWSALHISAAWLRSDAWPPACCRWEAGGTYSQTASCCSSSTTRLFWTVLRLPSASAQYVLQTIYFIYVVHSSIFGWATRSSSSPSCTHSPVSFPARYWSFWSSAPGFFETSATASWVLPAASSSLLPAFWAWTCPSCAPSACASLPRTFWPFLWVYLNVPHSTIYRGMSSTHGDQPARVERGERCRFGRSIDDDCGCVRALTIKLIINLAVTNTVSVYSPSITINIIIIDSISLLRLGNMLAIASII